MSEAWVFALKIIGIVLVSYMIGNINFATIIARSRKVDIHKVGSGNPGTMNMLRTFGVKVAVLTLFLDVLKGLIPAIAGYYLMQIGPNFGMEVHAVAPAWLGYYTVGFGKLGMLIGGVSSVFGHSFPVVNKFRGGKGVATMLGVFFAINPIVALSTFLCGVIYLAFGHYGFISSFICIICASAIEIALAAVYKDNIAVIILLACMMVLIVALHHENIKNLINGKERDSNLRRFFTGDRKNKSASAAADGEPNTAADSAVETSDGAMSNEEKLLTKEEENVEK